MTHPPILPTVLLSVSSFLAAKNDARSSPFPQGFLPLSRIARRFRLVINSRSLHELRVVMPDGTSLFSPLRNPRRVFFFEFLFLAPPLPYPLFTLRSHRRSRLGDGVNFFTVRLLPSRIRRPPR